jgi:hypothetical protein
MVLTVILCMFLILDRHFLFSPSITAKLGLKQYYSKEKGIGVWRIDWQEPIREVDIINRLARSGNCVTNELAISSCAVWHCPDKPFFMYGNGPVMSARIRQMQAMLSNIASEEVGRFMDKHNIKTVILTNCNETILKDYDSLSRNLKLIYMDPYMAILVRKGSITEEQEKRIKNFYTVFRPGVLDSQRFADFNTLISQYLLLWFSAEMTRNDGTQYLTAVEKYVPQETLDSWKSSMASMLEKR